MASRGRAGVGKRPVLPNLALAGKREDKAAGPSQPKKKKSDRGGRRGGRGRGRGGHDGKERPGLIESSGIFSEGLSGADPGRRKIKDESEAYTSVPRVKEEVKSGVEGDDNYQPSYEEIWESDDEGDIQELSELFKDGFISDYKPGNVLPHVLPLELQPQFVDLMHKDTRQDILDEEDEVKAEIELDIKDHILPEEGDDQETADGESPTGKRSRKAARIFKSLDKETRESELFMIQLPSILKFMQNLAPASNEKPTVEELKLPAGHRIGKLVITKGGRVYLRAGGHCMDVAHTASENQHQGVVMVETTRDAHAMQNGCGRFGDGALHRGGANAIYYMGQVHHHLTASLDWKQLRPIGMEKPEPAPSEGMLSPSRSAKPVDLERMKKELADLQKQRTADIAATLKRWNAS
ncbi:hypothetical protein OESDEN_03799 [Oesophagostomum dentatum]|uniref:Uncharacterized protein n=1 Tax=Oesophagostomum dentatum TaxID=61180 RepID=A0A0B1TG76_OESDE|nr:hypothetical protein OESDEN_03799 [Oesophagostomum dentatum]